MNRLNIDKLLKLSLAIGVIVISFSLAFYFVYFLPSKDRTKENVRKECANWALNKAHYNKTESSYDQELYDDYFARCLREKGL